MAADTSLIHYGKSSIRVAKVVRRPDRHDVREITVSLRFRDRDATGSDPTHAPQLTADVMAKTVYAVAREHPLDQIEEFGLSLNDYFLMAHPQIRTVDIDLAERGWTPLTLGGRRQPTALAAGAGETRVALVSGSHEHTTVEAGTTDLVVLRSFGRRETEPDLDPSHDGLFAADVTAYWRYARPDVSFRLSWQGVRQVLLEALAEHDGRRSDRLPGTMAESVLRSIEDVTQIRVRLRLRPYRVADLSALGIENAAEVYAEAGDPFDELGATLARDDLPAQDPS